jgi:peptide/nickel transport system substrate-binding protein
MSTQYPVSFCFTFYTSRSGTSKHKTPNQEECMTIRSATTWAIGLLLSTALAACAGAPAAPAPAAPAAATTAPAAEAPTGTGDSALAAENEARPWINLCEGEPVQGGTVTLAWADDAMVSRNWLSRGSTNESFVHSQLLNLSIEDGETIEPDVAEHWDISDDGLTYTFHLRQDVLWHDGEPLTAEDIKFTIEMLTNPEAAIAIASVLPLSAIDGYDAYVAGEADEITGVEVVDEYTVVITLSEPNPFFFYGIGGMNLHPKHVFENIPMADVQTSPEAREQIIGSGPFKMGEFVADQYYILEANEDYYLGRPHLDRLIFRIGLTSVAAWLPGLESDEIQIGSMVNGPDRERVESLDGLTVVGAPLPGAMAIWPNHNNFPDKRVLQAIFHALDRQAIVEGIYGAGQALVYDFDNIDPNHNWISPDVPKYEYDPDLARTLLEEAGWDFDQEISFITYYQTELDRNVTAAMQQFWTAVGLNVNIEHMDGATWGARVYQEPDYDLGYGCCGISVPYEYPRYACANVPPGGTNASAYCNEEVDELVEQALAEADPATRQQLWHEISMITNEELLHLTLFQQDRRHAVDANVCNYQFRQWSNIIWPERNPHTWYLAQ